MFGVCVCVCWEERARGEREHVKLDCVGTSSSSGWAICYLGGSRYCMWFHLCFGVLKKDRTVEYLPVFLYKINGYTEHPRLS